MVSRRPHKARPIVIAAVLLTVACVTEETTELPLPAPRGITRSFSADGALRAALSGGHAVELHPTSLRVRLGGRWQPAGHRLAVVAETRDDGLRLRPTWRPQPGDGALEGVEWRWRLRTDAAAAAPRWTQLGYAKFSPAGVAMIERPLPIDAEGALAPGLDDPQLGLEPIIRGTTPDPQRGWWSTTVRMADDAPLVGLGACSARRWKTRLGAGRTAEGEVELALAQGTPGDPLPATEPTPLETICIGAAARLEDLEAGLIARFESGFEPRPSQPAPRFFSTWHADFFRLDMEAVDAELVALGAAGYRGPFSAFQLDDGWQPRWGDWTRTRDGFGADLTAAAARIAAAGYRPGIWLTPSLADPESALLRAHPDWVLRDAESRTVSCGLCSVPYPSLHALDWSRPEVAVWFGDVLDRLQDAGFRMFKLDFLVYSAAEGVGADPTSTALDRYRRMLETVRSALRPDSLAWAATQPLWPTLGALDGQRVAADLGFEFFEELPTTNRMMYVRALGLRGGWLSAFGQIDPDAFFARGQPTAAARRGLAALAAMSGSMYSIGDRPADIGEHLRPDRLPAPLQAAIGSGEPFRPADPLAHPTRPWTPFPIVEAFLGYDAWQDAQDTLWWRARDGGLDLVVMRWDTGDGALAVDLTPLLERLAGQGRRASLRRLDGGPAPQIDGPRARVVVGHGEVATLRLEPRP